MALQSIINAAHTTENSLEGLASGLLQDLRSQVGRVSQDAGIASSLLSSELNRGLNDDRNYLTERVIQLATSLPDGSVAADNLTFEFIKTLWDNLQHPPLTYLGDEFRYRAADGSNNNIMYPNLGKAGSPYARSVTPQTPHPAVQPDPAIIFDSLFARKGPAQEHPSRISSILFYFATIIIHDLFRTSDNNPNRVENSSYLDLGPLYGHNEAQQTAIRTFKDGTLKPDAFSEPRILGQPPGVCALLICFNRFHNYVVGQLAEINEAGRFSLPAGVTPDSKEAYETAQLKRDNDLFQTGRLVTCGLYVNIILGDYVSTILNLYRSSSSWRLDPRASFDDVFDMTGTPRGIGNQVSVEFNLIYRWHSTISDKDEKWAQGFYEKLFPGKDPSALSLPDFLKGLQAWAKGIDSDPGKWTFGGLNRNTNGGFNDEDLVKILVEGTEDVAGAFGARNVPAIMKAFEILGMEQARGWRVASLNELRKFFGLTPHTTFLDINSDPEIATTLEALYTHPDNVELYPGVTIEETKKPLAPSSGLCPGYTISKAILSDAVALVRGDRFYTVDYSPANLTSWGFHQVSSDPQVAAGGVMYKLLMRALPGFYRSNSVYAMFPFTVPEENRNILQSLGKDKDYDFSTPSFVGPPQPVLTWSGVTSVLSDQAKFKVPWGPHTYYLTGHDYMLSGDKPPNAEQKQFVGNAIYSPHKGLEEVRQFYESLTTSLIQQKSHKLGESYQLDFVKDVGNLSHAIFIAHLFHIPIKSADHPNGAFSAAELYNTLALLFAYVFSDLDTASSFALRTAASTATTALGTVVKKICEAIQGKTLLELDEKFGMKPYERLLSDYGIHLIERLFAGDKSVDEVTWTIIPTAAAAVATQAQGIAQMLDLFLSDKYKSHWSDIQKLAMDDSAEAFEKLQKYALEGYRLATPAFGLLRVVDADSATIEDGGRNITVKKGDQIYVDFVTAGMDPTKFPDPEEIKLDRPDADYIHHGWGPHACLGRPIVMTSMAAQLKVFAKLKNLRRAPGLQGQLKSTTVNGAVKVFMKEDWSDWWAFPTTLKVLFDDF